MKTGYKVCDAMTRKPVAVSSDLTIQECARIMSEQHVGALLVKKKSGLAGIITEQDIVRKSVIENDKPSVRKVGELMEQNITTIEPEKDIYDALVQMKNMNIRHLPVVAGGEMIGLLTLKDILKIQPQLFDLLVEHFEIREEEKKPLNTEPDGEGVCQMCGKYAEKLFDKEGAMVCIDCRQ